ncbi:hypothetical protein FGG78_18140 [Thioclava sp. BHET1]|nr:hypothetical protein FGG78_18140 [Thioclava sp. BHET1]
MSVTFFHACPFVASFIRSAANCECGAHTARRSASRVRIHTH